MFVDRGRSAWDTRLAVDTNEPNHMPWFKLDKIFFVFSAACVSSSAVRSGPNGERMVKTALTVATQKKAKLHESGTVTEN